MLLFSSLAEQFMILFTVFAWMHNNYIMFRCALEAHCKLSEYIDDQLQTFLSVLCLIHKIETVVSIFIQFHISDSSHFVLDVCSLHK